MADFDTFDAIYESLEGYPGLSSTIGMEKGMAFVRLATRLKDEILSQQGPGHGHNAEQPPRRLPQNVRNFLGNAVDIPDDYVQGCWDAFGQIVWQRDANGDSVSADARLFREYGLQNLLCKLFSIHFIA
jgi:hypothetical protein